MQFPAPIKATFQQGWERRKKEFEKDTGKSKPGGWFSNKSGLTEALGKVDDAFGDLEITVSILKKQVTASMAKQLETKVETLEKAHKLFEGKATAYCGTALSAIKAGSKEDTGPKGAADYDRNVKALVEYVGAVGETVTTHVLQFRNFSNDVRKEALKALKSGQQDEAAKTKLLKALDAFELRMQQYGKSAKDLQRNPDAGAFLALVGKIVKADAAIVDAFGNAPLAPNSPALKSFYSKRDKLSADLPKSKSGKGNEPGNKELVTMAKRVAEWTEEVPKLVAAIRKELDKVEAPA